MKPIIVLDTNAVFGPNALTRADSKEVLALSRAGHVRLVIPSVVLHELSRQWAKRFTEKRTKLLNALEGFNSILGEVGDAPIVHDPPVMDRSEFYGVWEKAIQDMKAEVLAFPNIPIADVLFRDLDFRKPFSESGKGFRDALLWETVRELCNGLDDPETLLIFVTANHSDFCVDDNLQLHPHLQSDISPKQKMVIVKSLAELLHHDEIEPLAKMLRVAEESLTLERVVELSACALEKLYGQDLTETIGEYIGEGMTVSPIDTLLEGGTFDEILPDDRTVNFEVFSSGEPGQMAMRVTVETDCTIDGYVYKSDLAVYDVSGVDVLSDWNSHMMHASESRRIRFTLGADFTKQTIEDFDLAIEQAEDITI
ncbi:hypothetical protein NYA9BBAC_01234 [Salinibacterium sp. NYA9b]